MIGASQAAKILQQPFGSKLQPCNICFKLVGQVETSLDIHTCGGVVIVTMVIREVCCCDWRVCLGCSNPDWC